MSSRSDQRVESRPSTHTHTDVDFGFSALSWDTKGTRGSSIGARRLGCRRQPSGAIRDRPVNLGSNVRHGVRDASGRYPDGASLCYLDVMAMAWDSVLTAAVARELRKTLSGQRLKAVFLDRGAGALQAFFRGVTLLVDLEASRIGLELLPATQPPDGSRALACRVATVESLPDERVLVLVLPRMRGRQRILRIVLDLTPKRRNATVVEGDDWTVRHTLTDKGGRRRPRAGWPYAVPSSTRRGMEAPLTLEEWFAILGPEKPEARGGVLLRNVAATSPINVGALLAGPGGAGDPGDAEILASGHALWLRLRSIALGSQSTWADTVREPSEEHADMDHSADRAYLLHRDRAVQPYPVCLPGYSCRESPSLVEAIRETRRAAHPAPHLIPSVLTSGLERARSAALRRTAKLRRQLENTPNPLSLRSKGDLILSHLASIVRGDSEATLSGFDGKEVSIALDPALTPQENAARYYDRAGRAERAAVRLPGLIRASEQDEATLSALQDRVERGEATAEEVRDAVPEQELRVRSRRGGATPAVPYRVYRTSGGLEVRVGRGSGANDDLTFRHSRPDDVWLHARDASGAHVILRWTEDGPPPARDLYEAAVLAALHSKARTSGSVPVDWTRRRYVRKLRRSAPGRVVAERVKTLFVEPDPVLAGQLKA